MITTSDAYKEAIRSLNRDFNYRVRANGSTVISPGSITKIEIEESGTSGNALTPGSFCKNSCHIRVLASEFAQWRGSYFTIEITCNNTDWILLGKYWVYNVTSSGNKIYYEIEAYNVPSWWMEEPNVDSFSVSEFLDDIQNNTGMSIINPQVLTLQDLGTLLYPANDLFPGNELYPLSVPIELPEDSTNLTLLGYIAGYSGYNTKVTRNGNIYFFRYDGNSSVQYVCSDTLLCSDDQLIGYYPDISEAQDKTMWVERSSEFMGGVKFDDQDFVVGSIMVVNGQTTYQVGSGSSISYENPYITSSSEIDTFYRYLNYRGCSVKWRGNPAVEIGDILRVELGNGEWGNALVMRQKFSIDGGLTHTFECLVNESAEKVIGQYSPVQLKIKAVYNQVEQMYANAMTTIFGAQDGYFNFIDENERVLKFEDISGGATIAGFQITDSPTVTPITKGWRFIYGGLYFSSDGFQTPVHFALTNDGSVNADAINTGVLSAIEVNGVTIRASDMFFGDPDNKYVEAVTTSQEDGIIFQGNGVIDFKSTGDFDVKNLEADGETLANRLWLTNSESQNDTYFQNTMVGNGRLANQVHLYTTESAITTFLTNWNFSAEQSTSSTNANNVRLQSSASENRIDLYNRDENGNIANQLYLRKVISSTSPKGVAYISNRKILTPSQSQNLLEMNATPTAGTAILQNNQVTYNKTANYLYLASGTTYNSINLNNYFIAHNAEEQLQVSNGIAMAVGTGATTMSLTNFDFTEHSSYANRATMSSVSTYNRYDLYNYFPETNTIANQLIMQGAKNGSAGSVLLVNNDQGGSQLSGLSLANQASLYTASGSTFRLNDNGTFFISDAGSGVTLGSSLDGYLSVKTGGQGAWKVGWIVVSGQYVLGAI